ncbi:Polyketide cyclase/dehydrase and lipid transport superfamily protein [Hibiscus syriacus]|uniref:Polyketide cyclase/dehydrase and lipid transport superfamily protein n=1 Tax=Hibiscus syriacus TaxID=106335 RepID=A0A6A3CIP9_HIBSY|nr:Polyketide cyclase/dehydrase and lipid transport superfamily protein [Hibiscus syriacus]
MGYLQTSLLDPSPLGKQVQGQSHAPPPSLGGVNGAVPLMPNPSSQQMNGPIQPMLNLPSPGMNGTALLPSPTSQFLLPSPTGYMNLLFPPITLPFSFAPGSVSSNDTQFCFLTHGSVGDFTSRASTSAFTWRCVSIVAWFLFLPKS